MRVRITHMQHEEQLTMKR